MSRMKRLKVMERGSVNLIHLTKFALLSVIAVFLSLSIAVLPALAGQWQGKEETRDGVRYVLNPANPMEKGTASDLKELWRIGGDTDDEDEFFGVISQILTDDAGNVYLLDTQLAQVSIFSADGEFLRVIGREGEGPGEFRLPSGMFFMPDGNLAVVQTQPGKIVLLSTDGEPAGEHPLPKTEDGGFLTLVGGFASGDNVVLQAATMSFAEGRFEQVRYLASVNSAGEELNRYVAHARVIEMGNPVMNDSDWDTFDRRWTVGLDGRVYAATSYPDYQIHVWDPDGKVDRIIERAYKHRPRTEQEKKLMNDLMSLFAAQIPNCTVNIEENTKDLETLYVRADGSLWAMSSDGQRDHPDGSLGIFDVFDPQGRYVTQFTLNGEGDPQLDGYYFVNDRLYVVTDLLQAAISLQSGGQSFDIGDEEPEPMSVICYQLDDALRTSSR